MGAPEKRFKRMFEKAGGLGGSSPLDNSRYNVYYAGCRAPASRRRPQEIP